MPMSAIAPQLLLLAAGLGRRFGSLKQMAPVGPHGECIMDYTVFDAARAGVRRLVVVLRKEIEAEFHRLRGAVWNQALEVVYVRQDQAVAATSRERPWGTAHAVLAARSAIDSPFLVANADDFYGAAALGTLIHFLRQPPASAHAPAFAMIGYPLQATLSPHGAVSRGVCTIDSDGLLRAIHERSDLTSETPDLPATTLVSMNIWALIPSIFPSLADGFARFAAEHALDASAEYYLPEAIQNEIQSERTEVRVFPATEPWFGVTHPDDLGAARARIGELIASGAYPAALWGRSA